MTNYHVNIKDNKTDEVIKKQDLLITILIQEPQNDLIKPPSEGGYSGERFESGEIIIGDTLLRKYVPHQVKKMINLHKVMFGFEICISESTIQCKLYQYI